MSKGGITELKALPRALAIEVMRPSERPATAVDRLSPDLTVAGPTPEALARGPGSDLGSSFFTPVSNNRERLMTTVVRALMTADAVDGDG
jgi:hypothetical protein